MKQTKKEPLLLSDKYFPYILLLLSISILILGLYLNETKEVSIVETECFDRYGHVIKDMVCEEELSNYSSILSIELLIIFGVLGIFTSILYAGLRGTEK